MDVQLFIYKHGLGVSASRTQDAAIKIQAAFSGYRVCIGPLRFVLRSLRFGNLISHRAGYHVAYRGQCSCPRRHGRPQVVALGMHNVTVVPRCTHNHVPRQGLTHIPFAFFSPIILCKSTHIPFALL